MTLPHGSPAFSAGPRRPRYVGLGVLTYALLAGMSLASSFGFAAEGRDAVMSERGALAARYRAAAAELGEIEVKLKQHGQAKASGIAGAELKGLETEPRWRLTRGCTVIRGPENTGFCRAYAGRSTELAAARAAEALEKRRGELRKALADLADKGALRAADRQTMYASLLGVRKDVLRNALVCLLALVVEVGRTGSLSRLAAADGSTERNGGRRSSAMGGGVPRARARRRAKRDEGSGYGGVRGAGHG